MTSRELAAVLVKIKPGSNYRVPYHTMRAVEAFGRPYGFAVQDWVLEHIIGSSYELGYYQDLATGDTIYFKLAQPLSGDDGRRTYVSPDYLHSYRRRIDRIYEPV